MTSWIQATYQFESHHRVFYLYHKDAAMLGLLDKLKVIRDDPRSIEEWCELMIERHRPEYRGCTVFALEYSVTRCRWEFCIIHPSLPAVKPGDACGEEPLIPREGRE